MNLATTSSQAYSLIDSGHGRRLEKFGANILIRPDNTCIWHPQESKDVWLSAHATYEKMPGGEKLGWKVKHELKTPWQYPISLPTIGQEKGRKVLCELRMSGSKNIGIYPEQLANWQWLTGVIKRSHKQPKILNLFGYTGAATLVAAACGAEVVHVDASQSAVTWARSNHMLSELDGTQVRWIVDDCLSFMKREIKRGAVYDGIIMDPPAFGRDPKGNVFVFEKQIHPLLEAARELLGRNPGFMLLNSYALSFSPTVVSNLMQEYFHKQEIEAGELQIMHEDNKRALACSVYARFSR